MTLRNLHTTKAEYVLEKNGMRRKSAPHWATERAAAVPSPPLSQVAKVRKAIS